MHDARSYVLVLGAGGKVSAYTVPLLIDASHHVSALAHNPKHAERLAETGATVIIQDLTKLDREGWARLLTPFDVVVWSAGAGGGDPERTYAVDRDAAMVMIDALEELGEFAPLLINVSYAGAQDGKAKDDGSSWSAYVEAKKAVDLRLLSSEIDQVILGPTLLTDEPVTGIKVLNSLPQQGSKTSRELVAQVIAEIINRGESFDQNPFEFEDGTQKLQDL
ncbi:NAD(P)H-binding protein [Corynebacterium sp. HMSC29G08]|uniref:NAD(P)H-binding protein n=1 Tax=Corynebacterium sp. HMSC29G08 TaxID=1581069 RepID=UPI0008A28518|nr:NAD(P)H-binding protein [Corynebacterium sp. HMSC29G08]OFT85868.1 nucleoside-diphosphate sugar epimerase [Corynebacterium sp. HMSC29G08]